MVSKSALVAGALAGMMLCGTAVAETLSWSTSPINLQPLMPAGIQMNGTAVVTVEGNTFAYIIGGNRSTGEGGDTTRIHFAPVSGRNIGPWNEAMATLEGGGTTYHTRSTVTYRGRIYVVGSRMNMEGNYSTTYNGIRVFEPDKTGDIPARNVVYYTADAWGTLDPRLDLLEMAAVVNESRVHPGNGILYILGGGLGDDATNAVRSVRIDGESGYIAGTNLGGPSPLHLTQAVTPLEPLPENVAFHQAVIHDGRIYLAGNNPPSTTVYFAEILDDDTLGTWKAASAPLPEARLDAAAASFHGNLYVIGGTAGTNADTRNTVFRAVFGEDGDITAWETDASVPVSPGVRRVGATVSDDALFIIGGRLTSDRFSHDVQVAVPKSAAGTDE